MRGERLLYLDASAYRRLLVSPFVKMEDKASVSDANALDQKRSVGAIAHRQIAMGEEPFVCGALLHPLQGWSLCHQTYDPGSNRGNDGGNDTSSDHQDEFFADHPLTS